MLDANLFDSLCWFFKMWSLNTGSLYSGVYLEYSFCCVELHRVCILVKNRAWSPPFRSPPLPFVTFFYIDFTSTEVPLFSQQVWKCYIWLRPYRRGLRFGTYLGWNFRFGLRSRGQNVSKLLFFYTNAQIGSVRSCSNGMNIGLYMGQIIG